MTGKRSQLAAVTDLERMANAVEADWPLLSKFLQHLRQTGECRLALLGLYGTWRTDFQKQPGRAIVLAMSATGMGATAIERALVRQPGLYPSRPIPPRRTIADWISAAKSSGRIRQSNPLDSEHGPDDPPQIKIRTRAHAD